MGKLRTDRKRLRQEEAEERQAVRDKRSDKQQIARLNTLLGKNKGAEKERDRLMVREGQFNGKTKRCAQHELYGGSNILGDLTDKLCIVKVYWFDSNAPNFSKEKPL